MTHFIHFTTKQDFIVILNTESAVDAFSGKGQVSLGSQLSVAAGPLGRTGEASVSVNNEAFAPVYTYSKSKGLFAGISLEGAVISERADGKLKVGGLALSFIQFALTRRTPLNLLL